MSFFDKVFELISKIKVALTPLLIAAFLAIVFYKNISDGFWATLSAALISLIGFFAAYKFVKYASKGRGAMDFVARVNASPELNKKEE